MTGNTKGRYKGSKLGTTDVETTLDYESATGRLDHVRIGGAGGTIAANYAYVSNSNLVYTVATPGYTSTNTYETNRDLRTTVANGSYATIDYDYNAIAQRDQIDYSGTFPSGLSTDLLYNSNAEAVVANHGNGTHKSRNRAYFFDEISIISMHRYAG